MTEKTSSVEKKKSRRIKATTGAWWKSTVIEVVDEPQVEQKSEQNDDFKNNVPPPADTSQIPPPDVSSPKETISTERTFSDAVSSEGGNGKTTVEALRSSPDDSGRETDTDRAVTTKEAGEKAPILPKSSKRPGRTKTEKAEESLATEEVATPAGEAVDPAVAAVAPEPVKESEKRETKRPARAKKHDVVKSDEPVEESVTQEIPVADVPETEEVESGEKIESKDTGAETVSLDEIRESGKAEAPIKKKKRAAQRRSRSRKKEKVADNVVVEAQGEVAESSTTPARELPQKTAPLAAAEKESVVPELPEEDEKEKESIVLKLLINAEEPEECRLALLENGRLESIHVSTINRTQTKNNIYKGRIVAIEPNLQAAFVDYGTEKNGFLPFSEIHPEYYKQELSRDIQALVESHQWKKLSITDVVEKGQDVMVQVVKEEVGKKGANMTTYLSLPGRSVVLMPGSDSSGISRKISGEERRSQLRTAMNSLGIPEGIGWIVRTASADITKTALARDVGYLLRLWEDIKKKAQRMDGVGQIYEDHQSVLRFLREHFDPSIEEILVDDAEAMEQVKEFIALLPSKQRDVKVRLHKGSRPIFNQFSVEDQIESIYQPRVNLPSGGSIVIEPTEALVSIDVNSGSTSKGKNFDQSIYQANMEAASEIGRQLRLRDLGGLIVVDFIDMRNKKHIRDVERQLKQSMKRDKAKVDFSRISKFGLMQISRQKLGSPIEAGNYRVCEHCKGRGTVRSVETLALFYLRRIQTGASRKHVQRVECHFPIDVAGYLLNNKRHEIHEHETRYDTEILINADPAMSPVENEIILHKGEKDSNDKKQG